MTPPPPLPVLLSIPHGGTTIPATVADRFALDATGWWVEDADAWTREIYDLGPAVRRVVACTVVRAVVDVNRDADDRPPDNTDGVVKSHTCFGKPVYAGGWFPTGDVAERLIADWHAPYHRSLELAAGEPGLELALDCHSMCAVAPPVAPDPGQPRPPVCLSNVDGATCPDAVLVDLAACFRESFGLAEGEVRLNTPFRGGHIIRQHGPSGASSSVPWVQVELSRALYLAAPWFSPSAPTTIAVARLDELRASFLAALALFFGRR